jgi:bifunctional UDP-N-acetylglucosamine pyrophosphorylase/glucosamine-1-phosphate N-acetyltransferase
MQKKDKIKVVILAAGEGTRMKSDLPKVLMEVRGKAMIEHLLSAIHESGVDEKPIIVVGYKKEDVIKKLGDKYEYVVQEERLGTGHAVITTEKILKNNADHILVLYGDSPFLRAETIKHLVDKHLESRVKLTMATVTLPDFEDWRNFFYKSFSRIVRNGKGEIVKDVQFRDANEEEKKIKEVNPCYFVFETKWLWEKLKTLNRDNDQKQYYLTDLVKRAIDEGIRIESIKIDPREALAANSKEELEILEQVII